MTTLTDDEAPPAPENELPRADAAKTAIACVAGALIPGLGHAFLRKWDRAIVFFVCITTMAVIGVKLDGCLFDPDFQSMFAIFKFIADAGSGLLYWIPWMLGAGIGDPTAYTHDFANVFLYVAGLLNMLTIVDVFDIARGRKP
jgi:Na+/melibiose symporter-like transporter